jgi:hypothetical protein
MMGISAISTLSALAVLSVYRERRGSGVGVDGVDEAVVFAGLTSGAKASSHVPSVNSTLVSSRVCRVEACWMASLRRCEALAVAFSK